MPGLLRRTLQWLGFVVLCNGVGFASSLLSNQPGFYQALVQPSWAPPAAVFGPVWTSLYTLMGTATFFVWDRSQGVARRRAMTAFAIQLALNAAWTPVFFALHQFGLAIVVIVGVFVSVAVMIDVYARIVRWTALLLLPLLLWVGFATALNISLWWLNRGT